MTQNLIKLNDTTFKDDSGAALSGHKLFVYELGSSDLAICYYDAAGTKRINQPIELDSTGFALVYVQPEKVYKTLVKNSTGNFTVASSTKSSGYSPVSASGSAYAGNSTSASLKPFNSSITFKSFPLVMTQHVIIAPLTLSINSTDAVPGATVLMRIVADGVLANVPKFVGSTQVTGSSGWDNTAGMVNLVQFQYDGSTYWFSIVQATGGSVVDLQQPSRVSATVSSDGSKVDILFNEDILATSLPTSVDFTGATVSSASIVNKTVTLTLSPAKVTGTTFNLAYVGSSIKDLAGNLAPSFTNSLTVQAADPTPIPVALESRDLGFNEISVGTYETVSGGSWIGGVSSTLKFVGDAIYETTNTSLAPTQGIIGLHPTAVAIGNLGSYNGIHVGIAYYGGNINILQQGSQVNYGGWAAGTLIRIKRTGSVFVAQKKVGTGNWTTFHTYSYSSAAPMSVNMILNDNNNKMSVGVY
jgi:hypothetical protein